MSRNANFRYMESVFFVPLLWSPVGEATVDERCTALHAVQFVAFSSLLYTIVAFKKKEKLANLASI